MENLGISKRLVIIGLGVAVYVCFAAAWLLIVAGIHFSNYAYLVAGVASLLGCPVFGALGHIVEALDSSKFSANENRTTTNN